MKSSELLEGLNAAIASLVGRKIPDMGVLHQAVKERTLPLLSKAGLEYNTWHVEPIKSPISDYCPLFSLDVELKQDRRTAERRGTITKLEFVRQVEGETIKDMIDSIHSTALWKGVADLEQSITHLRAEIARFESIKETRIKELVALHGPCEHTDSNCGDFTKCSLPKGHKGFHVMVTDLNATMSQEEQD
jgi:uncharacterized small protein (DUF1192 family)